MAIKSADQITIVDVTDAYSVMLTSEAYTFVGTSGGAVAGGTCSTQAVAFCGSNQSTSVTVTAANVVVPAGITASVTNNGTASPTITFTLTATLSSAVEAQIPVVVDGITVTKKFAMSVAKAGTNGSNGTSVTVSSTSVTYQVGTSGTTAPTGTWSTSVPEVPSGQFLWTKTVVAYSDGKSTTAYSVSYKGTNGTSGAPGTSVTVTSTSVTYQVSTSGTTTPTGAWSATVPNVPNGQFLWTKTYVVYSDGKSTTSYSVSYKGTNGTNGSNGADALTLTITSSGGTVFKNNTGSTVLTAHVFKGAIEQTITDAGVVGSLGSIKWYKGTSTTAIATSKTITVTAADVLNSMVYTAQLE